MANVKICEVSSSYWMVHPKALSQVTSGVVDLWGHFIQKASSVHCWTLSNHNCELVCLHLRTTWQTRRLRLHSHQIWQCDSRRHRRSRSWGRVVWGETMNLQSRKSVCITHIQDFTILESFHISRFLCECSLTCRAFSNVVFLVLLLCFAPQGHCTNNCHTKNTRTN